MTEGSHHGVFDVFYHFKTCIECGEEPDDDADRENDGAGFDDEAARSFPHMNEDTLHGREVVSRKLHDERSRIPRKRTCLFESDACEDDDRDTEEVHGRCHQDGVREEYGGDHGNDDRLCRAWDEGAEHDGHAAVTHVFDGAGRHDSRYTAAAADKDRDEGLAGETEFTENAVHDEGHTRHVAGVFQKGEEEENEEDLRHKAENSADTADDAVYDEARHPVRRFDGLHEASRCVIHDLTEEGIIHPVCRPTADGGDRDEIDKRHDEEEDRKRKDAVCDDMVDFIRGRHGDALLLFLHDTVYDLGNVAIALVDDDGLGIIIELVFAVLDMPIQMRHQLRIQLQSSRRILVSFEYFDGVPANELVLDFIGDRFFDVCDGMLDAAGEYRRQAKRFLIHGELHRLFSRFPATLPLQRRDLYDRAAQLGGEFVEINEVAILFDKVHHIDGHDHRQTDLHELCCKVQVTFQIRAIDDIQDDVRLFVHQIVSGDFFFERVRRKGIDPRQILDDDVLVSFEDAVFLFDCDTGPVPYVLGAAGQFIE